MLAEVMHMKYGIAIAGTHGKTTTTSMCSEIFMKCDLDPTVVVGGRLKSLKTNAKLGKGDFFITEADEFDRSFLALTPTFAVITSIDADHLDCYSDLDDIKESFLKFANKVPFYGSVICCNDDPVVREIIPKINSTIITYGIDEKAQYRAEIKKMVGTHSHIDVIYQEKEIGSIDLPLPGKHNIKNALAAMIVALEVAIPFEAVKPALESYKGVERRFEIKAEIAGITIVDDYAHHPTEVRATMESARQIAKNRTIVIFQPHLYSRTRDFYQQFAHELSACHLLIITDIYPAREKPLAGVTSELIVHEVQKSKTTPVRYMSDINEILDYLVGEVKAEDMVIFMGAGTITKYSDLFADRMKKVTV
jgi:UDP-N-acetylmuramate--alanine ligase